MDQAEIELIGAQVRADRKRDKLPVDNPRPFTLRNCRFPASEADLDPSERRQAVAVALDGVGLETGPEGIFGEDAQDEGLYQPEIWDVLDAAGALACRVWIYGVDNGTVFRGDTVEIVAGCSQGGLESEDAALLAALSDARARLQPEEIPAASCVRSFGD